MIDLVGGGYAARFAVGAEPAPMPSGLFAGSTRVLSDYAWTEAHEARVQRTGTDASRACWVEHPLTPRNVPADHVTAHEVRCERDGMSERVVVRSLVGRDDMVRLSLRVTSDMADQFALRLDGSRIPAYEHEVTVRPSDDGSAAVFSASGSRASHGTWQAQCAVRCDPPPSAIDVSADPEPSATLTWDLALPGHGTTRIDVSVTVLGGRSAEEVAVADADLPSPAPLLIAAPGSGLPVPAAGIPWFMALFGRDALWSARLAEPSMPGLLGTVVEALARLQGTVVDADRQEQPGKIVHEVRDGEFAMLDLVPYARYYGGVDTTPLWLMMLARCDRVLQERLELQARAAIAWIRGDGGLDATGFVRYSSDPRGLIHQGWKDSHDALLLPDGSPVERDIALVEVQGYAYAALRGAARMAADVWGDPALAAACDDAATDLRARFAEVFLVQGFPPIAVHEGDRPVPGVSSNAGHLLLTGILEPEQAHEVAERLVEPDMFTGYGLRTLATGEIAYSPGSYHRGSVWPHDTAIAMVGAAQCGLAEPAARLADGLLALFSAVGGRAPEFILGTDAGELPVVVPPQSADPQAWSRAAHIAASALVKELR